MALTTIGADGLPPYATMLTAYQDAHAAELQAMIADLPLGAASRVLDMACGAGAYTRWLAERLGPGGRVVGIDIDPAFLQAAEVAVTAADLTERVCFQQGDIADLPFDDAVFDLVWCAQSMYSLPDPLAALREMYRVVRPGGTGAVFENDVLHQILLPWPADLELAVRQAQLESFERSTPLPERFFLARGFCELFQEVGFADCRVTPYSSVRHAPLAESERTFLIGYLDDLRRRTVTLLAPEQRERFDALCTPDSPTFMLDDPNFVVTYIDLLACGTK